MIKQGSKSVDKSSLSHPSGRMQQYRLVLLICFIQFFFIGKISFDKSDFITLHKFESVSE